MRQQRSDPLDSNFQFQVTDTNDQIQQKTQEETNIEHKQIQRQDPFSNIKKNMFLTTKRQEQETQDFIDNTRFVSKRTFDVESSQKINNKKTPFTEDKKSTLNYGGRQEYKEEYEISFELKEQLEHLEMINRYIESKFSSRTPEVNFFLDDSNEDKILQENSGGQIDRMEEKIKDMLRANQGPFNGTCLRDTWSKGRSFFFLNQGDYIQVHNITDNGKYAHCEFEGQIGLLHINDIRVYGHVYNQVDLLQQS